MIIETPLKIEGIEESLYAGFWRRLGALILDGIIVLPVTAIVLFVNNIDLKNYYFTAIPTFLFALWYNVYMVKEHGGTLGKLIMGIKIIKINGEQISIKEAMLRHMVLLAFSFLSILVMLYVVSMANETIYRDLNWLGRSQYLQGLAPVAFTAITWLNNLWFFGELIVLLTNERKRAIDDFIAGTVVIKKQHEKAIKTHMVTA